MISELTFIRQYGNFWNQLLPGIDHYVRMVNSGISERFYPPIDIQDIPFRRALINSLSFKIFYLVINKQFGSVSDVIESVSILNELKRQEITKLKTLDNKELFEDEFSDEELLIMKTLSERLIGYFFNFGSTIVYPRFSGCGLILACSGDIYVPNTLFEIKAGESNFKKHDFFQLLLYCALNSVSSSRLEIDRISLFNPRNGLIWEENVDTVAVITSGYSSVELYGEIINYVGNNYQSI